VEIVPGWRVAGTGLTGLLIFAGKPTEYVTVKYLKKHTSYVFLSFTSIFSYLCSKKKTNTLHIGYV